jgi:RNA polymerase sigma-70 factor (ECF subfamily)
VVEANRAVAVAMADGPEAGLALLDALVGDPRLGRWPRLHVASAELLRRAGRDADALAGYRAALALGPPAAEVAFVTRRMAEIA